MVGSGSPGNSSSTKPAAETHGITEPISDAGRTESDLQRNVELEKVSV